MVKLPGDLSYRDHHMRLTNNNKKMNVDLRFFLSLSFIHALSPKTTPPTIFLSNVK